MIYQEPACGNVTVAIHCHVLALTGLCSLHSVNVGQVPLCCCNVTLGHVMYLWIMSFCHCVSCKSCVSVFHVSELIFLDQCVKCRRVAGPGSVCCRSCVSVLQVLCQCVAGPVPVCCRFWVRVLQVLCQCITCQCVEGPVSVCCISLCCRSCVSVLHITVLQVLCQCVTCHCVAGPVSVRCMSLCFRPCVSVLQVPCQCITCHCVAGPVSLCYLHCVAGISQYFT